MSGPNLILDKSALEALRRDELQALDHHFFLVVPPVLLDEVAADLGKTAEADRPSHEELVELLANKVTLSRGGNADWRELCHLSLEGQAIELSRRCTVTSWIPVGTEPHRGIRIVPTEREEKLARWQSGMFHSTDHEFATKWRADAQRIDIEGYRNLLSGRGVTLPRPEDPREALSLVDTLIERPDIRRCVMALLISELGLEQAPRRLLYRRWLSSGEPPLVDCGHYANFCARTFLLFVILLQNRNLLGPRPTHRLDLDYCLYLPFCEVFSSGDRFHELLVPLLAGEDQDFVPIRELKLDLRRLAEERAALSLEQLRYRDQHYGPYPVEAPDSIVSKLWSRHRDPWKPNSGNVLLGMTPDERKKLGDALRALLPKAPAVDGSAGSE